MRTLTYSTLQKLTTGFLTGDNVLPSDPEVTLVLLQNALVATAMKANSLHLMTLSTTANVLRLADGDYLIRMPELPTADTDTIDIDEELTFAVARFMASYISRDKGGIHVQAANRTILDYNAKTDEIRDQMRAEANYAEVIGKEPKDYTTEWSL